jgi:glucose/arabinose dehydrogenase
MMSSVRTRATLLLSLWSLASSGNSAKLYHITFTTPVLAAGELDNWKVTMRNSIRLPVLALATMLALSPPVLAVQTDAPAPANPTGVRAETVANGLVNPWGLAFLPNGDMLVTERPGRIRYIDTSGELSPAMNGAPESIATGQGGMLDITLDPAFIENRHVYVCFTERRNGRENGTSVARLRLEGEGRDARFAESEIIFRMEPAYRGGYHFGCRLVFAPDGKLFVTLGERNEQTPAQDLGQHLGKVVRINPDGSVPSDNPFVGREGARPEIWSYGHRNPQAAALNPATNALWVVEHGAKGGDEVNIIKPGANYGWPVISYGTQYSGAQIGVGTSQEGMEQPHYYWDPSIAPSGMAFYTGDKHPAWKGNLFVGALKFRQIHRLVLDDAGAIVAEEILLESLRQRIRAIRQSPDGHLYFLTDSRQGRVMRLVPRE